MVVAGAEPFLHRVRRVHSAWRRADAPAYECPPAPAVGRHLPLYFVRKGLRPAFGVRRRLIERLPRAALYSPQACPGGAHQFAANPDEDALVAVCSARRRAEALACECPPAPAVGRHLPLYFARKGIRPAFGVPRRLIERLPRALRSPHRTPSLVGAGRGLGKVKEEVTANGRRRGTFAQAPAHPDEAHQFAAIPDEDALRDPNARQKKTRQREGSAGSGLRGGRDPRNERCVASVVARVRR